MTHQNKKSVADTFNLTKKRVICLPRTSEKYLPSTSRMVEPFRSILKRPNRFVSRHNYTNVKRKIFYRYSQLKKGSSVPSKTFHRTILLCDGQLCNNFKFLVKRKLNEKNNLTRVPSALISKHCCSPHRSDFSKLKDEMFITNGTSKTKPKLPSPSNGNLNNEKSLSLVNKPRSSSHILKRSLRKTSFIKDDQNISGIMPTKIDLRQKTICQINEPLTEYKNITKGCQSDTSDSEREKGHPNRRFKIERQKNHCLTVTVPSFNTLNESKGIEHYQIYSKVSEMWKDVLNRSDFWKSENSNTCQLSIERETKRASSEVKIDYQLILADFVRRKLSSKETLYEKRFNEKLKDPDFQQLISDFYIPPAQVEVFYQKFTDNFTAEECLKQICISRGWSKPQYKQVNVSRDRGEFIFSCKLNTKIFTPKKSAVNTNLAKELAASMCLDWLGIQRNSKQSFCQFSENTYFGN